MPDEERFFNVTDQQFVSKVDRQITWEGEADRERNKFNENKKKKVNFDFADSKTLDLNSKPIDHFLKQL